MIWDICGMLENLSRDGTLSREMAWNWIIVRKIKNLRDRCVRLLSKLNSFCGTVHDENCTFTYFLVGLVDSHASRGLYCNIYWKCSYEISCMCGTHIRILSNFEMHMSNIHRKFEIYREMLWFSSVCTILVVAVSDYEFGCMEAGQFK